MNKTLLTIVGFLGIVAVAIIFFKLIIEYPIQVIGAIILVNMGLFIKKKMRGR